MTKQPVPEAIEPEQTTVMTIDSKPMMIDLLVPEQESAIEAMLANREADMRRAMVFASWSECHCQYHGITDDTMAQAFSTWWDWYCLQIKIDAGLPTGAEEVERDRVHQAFEDRQIKKGHSSR